jgi:hypothetical protein
MLQQPADLHGDFERLKLQVQQVLLPPGDAPSGDATIPSTDRELYFNKERQYGPCNAIHGWWRIFLLVWTCQIFTWKGLKACFGAFTIEPFDRAALSETKQPFESVFLPHYAWANGLSIYYANQYRSAFVLGYWFPALAVLCALLAKSPSPVVDFWSKFAEAAFISVVFVVVSQGRRRRWHERWVDYRLLAEHLRLARYLALLGGGGQQVAIPPHLATYGNPAGTWMHWHYRSVERAAGLITARLDSADLEAVRDRWVTEVLEPQITYHHRSHLEYGKMDKWLHRAGLFFFAVTLGAVFVFFAIVLQHLFHHGQPGETVLRWTAVMAVFEEVERSGWGEASFAIAVLAPVLAGAVLAIRNQSEAQRLTRRSLAMQQRLEQLKLDLASLPLRADHGHSQQLRATVDQVCELMTRELLDWRVVVLDRPLETS